MTLTRLTGYRQLLERITHIYTKGRLQAMQAVIVILIKSYLQVGRHIVEFEQGGKIRHKYSKSLISTLAYGLKPIARERVQPKQSGLFASLIIALSDVVTTSIV